MSVALLWLRRDLRLTDNPALAAARKHENLLPVFIWAPEEDAPWAPGAASRWWLHRSLVAFRKSLAEVGLPLVIRRGASLQTLISLVDETGARAVYWNRLYEPAGIARDRAVECELQARGVATASFNAALLAEPWALATASGQPFRVFTPFYRALERWRHTRPDRAGQPSAAPGRSVAPGRLPPSLPLSALELLPRTRWDAGLARHWRPGEAGAQARLAAFVDGTIGSYRERRDFPAARATSRLSPHLHFGEISPSQCVAAVEYKLARDDGPDLRRHAEWFVRELAWREFAHHLLHYFPRTPGEAFYAKFSKLPCRAPAEYRDDLAAWRRGATGVPLIDAGMRELWHSGWMHNRVRMCAASFLAKNLLIPWQEGARWFWDTLVDADLANNTLGWQWSAGCGADAAPYFRVFNPVLQSEKFDADGCYLKRWIPELRGLSGKLLHAPWRATAPVPGYPTRIVDLGNSRRRALDAYSKIRGRTTSATGSKS